MSNFQPHIFINTEFKRTNQSITSLVALHHQRIIDINDVDSIPNIIHSHYVDNAGSIGLWGDVVNYKHFTSEGECTVYDVAGEVIGCENIGASCTDEPTFLV